VGVERKKLAHVI